MIALRDAIFVCMDVETTGLDAAKDHVIEVAVARFTLEGILESWDSLVNPGCPIAEASIAIHHITDEMVLKAPSIGSLVPRILALLGSDIIIGHGIAFDVEMVRRAADREKIPHTLDKNRQVDTLRLARLYGESPTNSLEMLRQHFNIPLEGAHRALADVTVNVAVFKYLICRFKTVEEMFETLAKPIEMRTMPLGKYKGRLFRDIPLDYLQWSSHMDFDEDLLYSIRSEIKRRKKGGLFSQASNPFGGL